MFIHLNFDVKSLSNEDLSDLVSKNGKQEINDFFMFKLSQFLSVEMGRYEKDDQMINFSTLLKLYVSKFDDVSVFAKNNPELTNYLLPQIVLFKDQISDDLNYRANFEDLIGYLEEGLYDHNICHVSVL